MSGTSWTGGKGKPSSRPPSIAFKKKKHSEFNKLYDKKKSKFY